MANAPVVPAEMIDSGGTKILENGTLQFQPNGSGATPLLLRSFGITFATAGLASGVTIYTPAVGDVIYDIGVGITTAFDGTTPKLDVGTFNGGTDGLFKNLATAAVDGTKVYADVTHNAGLGTPNSVLWLNDAVASHASAGTAAFNPPIMIVSAANPLLVVASQDGTKGGTAITSTHGVASIFVLSATPISF